MDIDGFTIESPPDRQPRTLIAGFGGWADAMEVTTTAIRTLVRQLGADPFARIDADRFFRYDASRPIVNVEDGLLKQILPPSGIFYLTPPGRTADGLVLLRAEEPHLNWNLFVRGLLSLARGIGVDTVITLGSMYDGVLPTDQIISGIASQADRFEELAAWGVSPVSYKGPSAIHSIIQAEAVAGGFAAMSLWCHCPYYLQGTTHYGMLSRLLQLLSDIGRFAIDTADIDAQWDAMSLQISELIDNSPDLQEVIAKIRKEKVRGSWSTLQGPSTDRKVIDIRDFLDT